MTTDTIQEATRTLPKGWRWVRLGDIIADAQPGFASGERDSNGVIQIRMNNLDTRGNLLWDSFIRVPSDKVTVAKYLLLPGDVLFNNTNSTELVGKSALFRGHEEPIVFSNHFTRLRCVADRLHPNYLALWLVGQWQSHVFAQLCNKWIGQSAVKNDKLLALEIPLPSLSEQRRIAALLTEQLTAVEQARAAAKARLEATRALPAALLRQVFESEEALSWEYRSLRDICLSDGQYGTSDPSSTESIGIPVLRMGNLQDGRISWDDLKYISLRSDEEAKYRLTPGDILFNRTNSAELVGKTAIFDGRHDAVFASYLVRFQLNPTLTDPFFVCTYINSSFGRVFIQENMARAIGQVNISASTMHRMPIPLPPLSVQVRLSTILQEQFAAAQCAAATIQAQLDAINALPTALLRRAFAGEV